MAYYRDLREHIKALETNSKLVRIAEEIGFLHPEPRAIKIIAVLGEYRPR